MPSGALICQHVTFHYPSMGEPVFEDLSVRLSTGWTGVIGPNGSGKTTLLRLIAGQLPPTRGSIHSPADVLYCPQRTDDPPEGFPRFLAAGDAPGHRLRGQLHVDEDWSERWPTLSHGERKRAQIATALWQAPDVLAIDEPTNHIDLVARRVLRDALQTYGGIGLLVSHDRDLLDGLCGQCLFIDPPDIVLRPGGYTSGRAAAAREQQHARRERTQARQQVRQLRQESARRREQASRSHQLRSRGKINRKDHDAMQKIGFARLTGKDGQAGRVSKQLDGRVKQAQQRLDQTWVKKDRRLQLTLRGERARRDALLRLPAGTLEMGPDRRLRHDELIIRPDDRIALIGPNGSGKSTLVQHMVDHLDIPAERIVWVSQELPAAAAQQALGDVLALDDAQLGHVMSVVGSLGSDPQRVIETDLPSPGEARKLMLALGLSRRPWLIVMDEPTNHLDLPSIECLENALADCAAALLLISHDLRFLKRLATTCWETQPAAPDGNGQTHLIANSNRLGASS